VTETATNENTQSDLLVIDENNSRELVRDLVLGLVHGGLNFLRKRVAPVQFEEALSRFGRSDRLRITAAASERRSSEVPPARPIVAQPHSKFLDERQLCAELGISPVTATKWRRIAEGPQFIRVGRLIRYPRSALEAWLAERTVGRKKTR
jgi:predicted DNA-binding transcriptional regulator AlpA